jgi:hypothetical protein
MEGGGASKYKNNEYSGTKGDRGRRGREGSKDETMRSDELKERERREEGGEKGQGRESEGGYNMPLSNLTLGRGGGAERHVFAMPTSEPSPNRPKYPARPITLSFSSQPAPQHSINPRNEGRYRYDPTLSHLPHREREHLRRQISLSLADRTPTNYATGTTHAPNCTPYG